MSLESDSCGDRLLVHVTCSFVAKPLIPLENRSEVIQFIELESGNQRLTGRRRMLVTIERRASWKTPCDGFLEGERADGLTEPSRILCCAESYIGRIRRHVFCALYRLRLLLRLFDWSTALMTKRLPFLRSSASTRPGSQRRIPAVPRRLFATASESAADSSRIPFNH